MEGILFGILWLVIVLAPPVLAIFVGPFFGFAAGIVAFGLYYLLLWWKSERGFLDPELDAVAVLILAITVLVCAVILLLRFHVQA